MNQPDNPLCVLIVEDDPAMVSLVSLALRYEGFRVLSSGNGLDGLRLFEQNTPDLMIVDWMLPGMDGVSLCRRVRALSDAPIIMITARDAVQDRIQGLDTGADDYIIKPFNVDELMARVRARLRRKIPASSQLTFADLRLDSETREVFRDRRRIAVTATEYKILGYFLRHPRQVLSKDQILQEVWGYDFGGDDNIVEQYVRSIRQKLGSPGLIQTVRGAGYALREEAE